jgi:hypothetical protein
LAGQNLLGRNLSPWLSKKQTMKLDNFHYFQSFFSLSLYFFTWPSRLKIKNKLRKVNHTLGDHRSERAWGFEPRAPTRPTADNCTEKNPRKKTPKKSEKNR